MILLDRYLLKTFVNANNYIFSAVAPYTAALLVFATSVVILRTEPNQRLRHTSPQQREWSNRRAGL